MSWPTQGEYNQAIQNPRIAFRDPELRAGTCYTNRFGVPVPWSGQNAAVYKVMCAGKAWAIKCFTHEVSDQQVRYSRISEHLAKAKLGYTVGFKFHDEGINVKGRWYPLLQMEWVEGERLNDYVRRHLSEPGKLQQLAQRVLQMVRDLQAAGIAHGDLQHGNILVCNEYLRLVDYDGVWVPSLAGLPPSEVGHPHYQHPDRLRGNVAHFDGGLDNFSLWVIVLGLYALSVEPSLWEQTGRGDDWLLLREEDFQPLGSPLLRRLERHADTSVGRWARGFRSLLFLGADRVRFPDVALPGHHPTAAAGGAGRKPDWIPSHRGKSERPTPETRPSTPDPTWPITHGRVEPGHLSNPVAAERVVLAVSFVVMIVLVPVVGPIGLPSLAAVFVSLLAVDVAFLLSRHRAEPDVKRLARVKAEAADFAKRLRLKQRLLTAAQRDREAQRKKVADEIARLRNEQGVLLEREAAEAKVTVEKRERQLAALAERRKRVDSDEAQALDRVRRSSKLAGLDAEINKLQAALSEELQRGLKAIQDQHIMDYLRGRLVERADLKGIGPTLKERLLLAGFRTAAEINPNSGVGWRRVEGIGSAKNTVLIYWRRDLERAAARTMPQGLTPMQAAQIRGRFVPQIEPLQREKSQEDARVNGESWTIRQRHANLQGEIEKEVLVVQPAIDAELRATHGRYAAEQSAIDDKAQCLEAATAEQLRETEERITRIERVRADLRRKQEGKQREVMGLATVAFGPYLRRVFLSAA